MNIIINKTNTRSEMAGFFYYLKIKGNHHVKRRKKKRRRTEEITAWPKEITIQHKTKSKNYYLATPAKQRFIGDRKGVIETYRCLLWFINFQGRWYGF